MAIRQSINTTLRGFLDLFQLRTAGANPQVMAEFIQPTMDLQRWYLEGRVKEYIWVGPTFIAPGAAREVPITATTPQNISNGVDVIVPQNEIWVAWPGMFIDATLTSGAGTQTARVGYSFNNVTGTQMVRIPTEHLGFDTSVIGERRESGVLQEPFFVQPGSFLRGYHFGVTASGGGQVDISGTLRLVRLRI